MWIYLFAICLQETARSLTSSFLFTQFCVENFWAEFSSTSQVILSLFAKNRKKGRLRKKFWNTVLCCIFLCFDELLWCFEKQGTTGKYYMNMILMWIYNVLSQVILLKKKIKIQKLQWIFWQDNFLGITVTLLYSGDPFKGTLLEYWLR